MTQDENSGEAEQMQTDEKNSSNWWNRIRYGLYAPVYDWVAKPFEPGLDTVAERVLDDLE